MAEIRVRFTEVQQFGALAVSELVVAADRLVLALGRELVLDVPVEAVAWVGPVGTDPAGTGVEGAAVPGVGEEGGTVEGASSRLTELRLRHANHGKAWTLQEDARLAEMWRAGAARAQMVEELGRSSSAIRSAAVRLGLAERRGGSHLSGSRLGHAG